MISFYLNTVMFEQNIHPCLKKKKP